MIKRARWKSVVVLAAIVVVGTIASSLLIVGAGGLWLRSYRQQEALNRQLIAALMKEDDRQALDLVNAGAGPLSNLQTVS